MPEPTRSSASKGASSTRASRKPTMDAGAPGPRLRRAKPADLDALWDLEKACYEPERRQSRRSLVRSLRSPRQSVWVAADHAGLTAALILWHHPRAVRIYGVHVRPDQRGSGMGAHLLAHSEAEARRQGAHRVILEADAHDARLLAWYEQHGYQRILRRDDFYALGRPAWRMEKRL